MLGLASQLLRVTGRTQPRRGGGSESQLARIIARKLPLRGSGRVSKLARATARVHVIATPMQRPCTIVRVYGSADTFIPGNRLRIVDRVYHRAGNATTGRHFRVIARGNQSSETLVPRLRFRVTARTFPPPGGGFEPQIARAVDRVLSLRSLGLVSRLARPRQR